MKFFCDRRATDQRAAFKYERLESGLGQIKGRDKTIVSPTDDDDVARFGHWLRGLPVFENFQRGESAGRAHDPSARMGRRSAHI